tara:strand:- start:23 stop:811 length:789 start_codon:yes stop_codon:yes gene_type:complete
MRKFYDVGIIGANGTVGKSLYDQFSKNFSKVHKINRLNFIESESYQFNILIVTCFDARKYMVNKYPLEDLKHINEVFERLKNFEANTLILISTIDVYSSRVGNEASALSFNACGYSFNRYLCELYIKQFFEKSYVIRLQGLVGKTIKKNFLYDLKHNNNVENIDKFLEVQYYPLSRIMDDILRIIENKLYLVNISCEPLSLQELKEFIDFPNFDLILTKRRDNINYCVESLFSHVSLNSDKKGFWVKKSDIISAIDNYFFES